MLIDTHAHLYWDSFKDDLDEVVKRSVEAGVTTIINVGTDTETSQLALKQIEELEQKGLTVYSSIGIHPHDAHKYSNNTDESIQKDIDRLEEIYHSKNPSTHSISTQGRPESSRRTTHSARSGPRVIAVGECGLDFNFTNPDYIPSSLSTEQLKDLQRKLLTAHVELAKKLNLPLIIHCRDGWDEIFDYISGWKGVLHCFSGDLEISKKALNTNFLISFAGPITYPKNEVLREVAKFLPLEKIVLETDSPFLPPQSKRGQRNEPSSVREIAQLLAELKNTSLENIAFQTTKNAQTIFGLT